MKLQDSSIVKNYPSWNNTGWDQKKPISVGAWVAKILNNEASYNLSNNDRRKKLESRWSFTGAIQHIHKALIGYGE